MPCRDAAVIPCQLACNSQATDVGITLLMTAITWLIFTIILAFGALLCYMSALLCAELAGARLDDCWIFDLARPGSWCHGCLVPGWVKQRRRMRYVKDTNRRKIEHCLPTTAVSDSSVCVVCLEALTPEDAGRVLNCAHAFHAECIMSWWMHAADYELSSVRCPVCRRTQPIELRD
mmetsp:Transcript_21789/g.65006  ORF Transcript_21789/g.65006 Transcript_21789/m.65006 type:complete len:176 (-) Transcript_21789:93-620(-)